MELQTRLVHCGPPQPNPFNKLRASNRTSEDQGKLHRAQPLSPARYQRDNKSGRVGAVDCEPDGASVSSDGTALHPRWELAYSQTTFSRSVKEQPQIRRSRPGFLKSNP